MKSTISDYRDSLPTHHELSDIPAKQIHRWEGEGGFIPPEGCCADNGLVDIQLSSMPALG
jgi:hypothetical protein